MGPQIRCNSRSVAIRSGDSLGGGGLVRQMDSTGAHRVSRAVVKF
jgi:hypothetical protein